MYSCHCWLLAWVSLDWNLGFSMSGTQFSTTAQGQETACSIKNWLHEEKNKQSYQLLMEGFFVCQPDCLQILLELGLLVQLKWQNSLSETNKNLFRFTSSLQGKQHINNKTKP